MGKQRVQHSESARGPWKAFIADAPGKMAGMVRAALTCCMVKLYFMGKVAVERVYRCLLCGGAATRSRLRKPSRGMNRVRLVGSGALVNERS